MIQSLFISPVAVAESVRNIEMANRRILKLEDRRRRQAATRPWSAYQRLNRAIQKTRRTVQLEEEFINSVFVPEPGK